MPEQELGVALPQESQRGCSLLSPVSLGHLPDEEGGDGVDRWLAQTARVGRRRRGVGRGRGTVIGAWEVTFRRRLGVEDDMGHLAGLPLLLEKTLELPRGECRGAPTLWR